MSVERIASEVFDHPEEPASKFRERINANGNLTADQNSAYHYDVENRLVEMHVRQSPSACAGGDE